jgi:DNA polymerase eta
VPKHAEFEHVIHGVNDCLAGISHYKILAKLGSGMHKPAQQTVVPANAVAGLLKDLPLSKLRGLGGDFGQHVEKTLNVKTCGT